MGWVTLVKGGEKFVSSRLRLDVSTRQQHSQQWARRNLNDRLSEEEKEAPSPAERYALPVDRPFCFSSR